MNAQQLKNAILQEAIEGRLVPQDPNDEPASALLDRIRKEKAQLVKEGKLKKKDLEGIPIAEEEKPFVIPESWEWVRLNWITEQIADCPHSTAPDEGKGYPLIRTTNVGFGKLLLDGVHRVSENSYNKRNERAVPLPNDLIYAREATAGNIAVIEEGQRVCLGQRTVLVKPMRGFVCSYWLAYFILSPYSYKSLVGESIGTTVAHVNLSDFRPFLLPLPPLAEQQRIVARIEELLPKVEEYGKAQEALDRLNAELPERLKKSILQEAIEGRLVPQDPNDEPASALLDRIRKEKAQLVKAGKLKKKDLEETPITEEEKPFEIPESWEWVRIRDIFIINPKVQAADDLDAAFIPMEKISACYGSAFTFEIRKWGVIKSSFTCFQDGDVAFAKITPCFQNRKSMILEGLPNGIGAGTTELKVLRQYGETINRTYLLYFLASSYFVDEASFKGTANQQRIIVGYLENKPFPLPPLAEQHRIVAKIEELLGAINALP